MFQLLISKQIVVEISMLIPGLCYAIVTDIYMQESLKLLNNSMMSLTSSAVFS